MDLVITRSEWLRGEGSSSSAQLREERMWGSSMVEQVTVNHPVAGSSPAPTATFVLHTVISGGQTGVDQMGLQVARELGYQTSGTCPKYWRTEDGPMEALLSGYGLVQSKSMNYGPRTRANVKDANGTVWFGNPGSPDGKLTIGMAEYYAKPFLVNPTWLVLRSWLIAHRIRILNVAGNRRRTNPNASILAEQVLREALHL